MTGFLLIFIGRTKEGFVKDAVEKYRVMVNRFVPVEIREIKGSNSTDHKAAMEEEAEAVISRLSPSDFVVILDEHGRGFDSKGIAGELGRLMDVGRKICFVTGGPFGLSDRLRERADLSFSLSKLTFTHEISRLLLMEQLYRSLTIIKGRPYHY